MDNAFDRRVGITKWILGVFIFLLGVVVLQSFMLLHLMRNRKQNEAPLQQDTPGAWSWFHPFRKSNPVPGDDGMIVRITSNDIHNAHDRINRLFAAMQSQFEHVPMPQPNMGTPTHPTGHARSSNPANDMRRLQEQMDRMVDAMFRDSFMEPSLLGRQLGFGDEGWDRLAVSSSMEMKEKDDAYWVSIALPGMDKSQIHIAVEGRILHIAANQETRKNPSPDSTAPAASPATPSAMSSQHFETRLMLPGPIRPESIQAVYENGVLTVTIPKAVEKESLARKIPVI